MAYESKAVEMARNAQHDITILKKDVEGVKKEIESAELNRFRERLAVIEDRVTDIKNDRSESDRRKTQYLYLTIGFVFTLLGTVLVQLLIMYLRK